MIAYPADARGWFESTDLAVFRQLGEKPQRLRDIQRRLRGIRKDACLASLRRAIDAGLAVELPGGLYQLPRHRLSSCDLSENRSQIPSSPDFEALPEGQITENAETPPGPMDGIEDGNRKCHGCGV